MEVAQRESVAKALLLVLAQPQQHDLAEQVAQLVRRRIGVAVHFGRGLGSLEARFIDQELDGILDTDLAAVQPDVEDDPAGSPDRVGVHDHAVRGRGVEALLAHHLLAVHAPALDELGRVDQQPGEAGMLDRRRELLVVPGVGLVDAGVADRRPVVLEHRPRVAVDRWRDDVDAAAAAQSNLAGWK